MSNEIGQSSNIAVTPQNQMDQVCTIHSLPEGREAFNQKFWPLFQRIMRMSGGNVRFGEHDSYFIDLPGGNNPYAYRYDDETAFAEIWQDIILAEHGWPSVDVLEQMLLADAEYAAQMDGDSYYRRDLSEKHRAFFDKSGRVIECQLKGRINDKDAQRMFFTIADEYDTRPVQRADGYHVVPYTKDGATWLWSLSRTGLKKRLATTEESRVSEDEQQLQKFAKTFAKQLSDLQRGKIIRDYTKINNGADVLFNLCTERLFFRYDDGGLAEFYHLVSKIQDAMYGDAVYGATVTQISRDTIRDWFVHELTPLANQAHLPLFIENDRKYCFPASGSTRRESFTLTNYRKVWRILADAVDKK